MFISSCIRPAAILGAGGVAVNKKVKILTSWSLYSKYKHRRGGSETLRNTGVSSSLRKLTKSSRSEKNGNSFVRSGDV